MGNAAPDDERHLHRAFELAETARSAGNRPFGSLLVSESGEVLREASNTTLTENDITAHPELKLARWAAQELDPAAARTTTMYTSCEPCPMCTGAIKRSGLGRVVYGFPSAELEALRERTGKTTTWPVAFDGPALVDEARAILERYYAP